MTDPYYKKTLSFKLFDVELKLDIAETLFSTFQIDLGSAFLLRNLKLNNPKSILDIGCGYGILGIYLAAKNPDAEVDAIDRDLLAVKYSNINSQKNNLRNYKSFGSVGVEEVKDKEFDLIVSNIPAKVGDEAIEQDFIIGPANLLSENGEYWIVIVSALNRIIPKLIQRNNLKSYLIKKRNGHIVYKITR